MTASPTLLDRFQGCLLGLMLGDALGSFFEGWSAQEIAAEYPTVESLFRNPLPPPWAYTDDTEMAIGVAEALWSELAQRLCEAYVAEHGV